MSVRSPASRKVSTEMSCAMSVSERNALTLRPVACSTTLVKASAICCWKRRRMCWIASPSPRCARVFSARVNVSSSTTTTRSSEMNVLALVGPLERDGRRALDVVAAADALTPAVGEDPRREHEDRRADRHVDEEDPAPAEHLDDR